MHYSIGSFCMLTRCRFMVVRIEVDCRISFWCISQIDVVAIVISVIIFDVDTGENGGWCKRGWFYSRCG